MAGLVECMTDNRNRTISEVRRVFDKYGGSMGAAGCVEAVGFDDLDAGSGELDVVIGVGGCVASQEGEAIIAETKAKKDELCK